MDDSQAETKQILMKREQLASCRTCMEYTNIPLNLYDAEFKYLLDLLNCLLGFEAKLINDEYIICGTCKMLLKQLADFKKTCLKSHEQFCNIESKEEELTVDKDIRTYLETALSSENEENVDFKAEKRSKRTVRRRSKSQRNTDIKKTTRRVKKSIHKQFPPTEVLEAIQECTNYIYDTKCLLCAFKGTDSKALLHHMKSLHNDFFKTWCYRCNILEYDLEAHNGALKCCQVLCKFCGGDFKKRSRLVDHLRLHCNLHEVEIRQTLEETGEDNCDNGSVNEEIITLRGDLSEDIEGSKLNGENEQPKSEPSDDDSDSKPLILRIKSKRRYTKRRMKHPRRYKDALSDDEVQNVDQNEANVNNGSAKGRMKCRLQQFDHEDVLQAIEDTIKPFKMNRECILCGFVASHSRALSVHMTLLHKDIKDSWCSRCNCVVDKLADHSEGHKNDILKCTFCGKSFNNFFHLKEHLKSHSRLHAYDIESKWYSCKVCPNSYPDQQKLKEHDCRGPDPSYTSKTKKKIKDSRFCVPCNKRVRSLPIHIKHKHNADGALKEPSNKLCSICGKSFSDNSKLTVHMRIHTGECPYKCSYCDKRCSTRNHLVVHERTHTGEKPHICYICGKAFAQSSVLGTHMKIHTGRPEQCSVCNQRFCRPAELKLHMRRHTGEKPYLCNNCGLSFHQRSHLVEHVKRHSNERPYKCSFCEKGFKQISVLKAHENIHTGLKPYKCTQCSYSCRQSYSLTVHMKQHSNDAPQSERPHKCLICNKHFSTHAMLMSHANNMHAEIVENEEEFSRIETVMDCS